MGYKCCVPGCTSGYTSCTSSEKPTIFRFPDDPQLRRKWLRNIHRDIEVTKHTRICHLHFAESDYETGSTDGNTSRQRSRERKELCHRKLKPHAFPSQHRNLPSYLSTKPSTSRSRLTSLTSSESRFQQQNRILKEQIIEMEMCDAIECYGDIKMALRCDYFLPLAEFEYLIFDNSISIFIFDHTEQVPQILCSMKILPDLTFCLSVAGNIFQTSDIY